MLATSTEHAGYRLSSSAMLMYMVPGRIRTAKRASSESLRGAFC